MKYLLLFALALSIQSLSAAEVSYKRYTDAKVNLADYPESTVLVKMLERLRMTVYEEGDDGGCQHDSSPQSFKEIDGTLVVTYLLHTHGLRKYCGRNGDDGSYFLWNELIGRVPKVQFGSIRRKP